jgi:hypothetical protein
MIVAGLVLGHWWRAALIAAALGWPLLLILSGVEIEPWGLPAAAVFGAANAAVGIIVHQLLWVAVRGLTSAGRKLIP